MSFFLFISERTRDFLFFSFFFFFFSIPPSPRRGDLKEGPREGDGGGGGVRWEGEEGGFSTGEVHSGLG